MAYLNSTTVGGKLNVLGELETRKLTIGSASVTGIASTITNDATKIPTAAAVKSYLESTKATFTVSGSSVKASAGGWVAKDTTVGTVGNCGTLSLALTDKGSTTITVGTENTSSSGSGYFPLTASLSGNVSTASAGWLTTGNKAVSDTSVVVGRIAKSTTGSAVSNTADSATVTLTPGTQTTISAGYLGSARIIRAASAGSSDVTAASGYSLSVSSISGSSAVSVGTLSNGYYPITANNLSVTATASASTAGWFSSTGSITDSDTDNVTIGKMAAATFKVSGKTVYCSAGGYVPTGSTSSVLGTVGSASSYTLSVSSISGSSNVSLGTKDGDGYYPITANNLSVTATASAGTAGWFSSTGSITDSDTDGAVVGKIVGSSTGSAVANTTDAATVTLDPGKQVTITAGYYPSARIIRASIADAAGESISAGTASFAADDKTTTAVGVGTLSSGYYPITASVSGTVTFASAGWIATTGAQVTDSTVTVGRMAAAAFTVSGNKVYCSTAGYTPQGSTSSVVGTVSTGSVTSSVSGTNPTFTPTVTFGGTKSNYGITTTKPSGTDGTNFISVTPGGSSDSQTFTAGMTLKAGYISSKGTEGTQPVSASKGTVTPEYIPIVTPAFDGGAASIKSSSTSASSSQLTMTDTDTDPGSGVLISTSGSATATRTAVLYNGAKKGLINIADNTSASPAADGSATTLTGNKYYITALTVPASKTFSTVTLTAGTSSARTYLTTLTVNGYTTINTLNCSGIIEDLNNDGGIITNLHHTSHSSGNRITNLYGTTAITNHATNAKSATTTITNNGYSSTYKGTLTVTTNTYGTVNVWNTGGDKGVQVANHTVKVDGTTVTNSSGDLITATPAFDGGGCTGGGLTQSGNSGGGLSVNTTGTTNVTLSDTNNGIAVKIDRAAFENTVTRAAVTRGAVLYNGAVSGWVSKADNAEALASTTGLASTTSKVSLASGSITKYISAIKVPASKTLSSITLEAGTSSSNTILSSLELKDYSTVNNLKLSGSNSVLNISVGSGETETRFWLNGTNSIGLLDDEQMLNINAESSNGYVGLNGAFGWLAGTATIAGFGGTFTITSNANGKINVWGTSGDKTVQIDNHTVTVDGVTVTNTNGDLKTGTITYNTSGGTSSGTITAGKQIKIGAGYYKTDAYYQAGAASSSFTNWDVDEDASGNLTFTFVG